MTEIMRGRVTLQYLADKRLAFALVGFLALLASGCDAEPQSDLGSSARQPWSGREILDYQRVSDYEVLHVVHVGDQQFAIPRAPYVRLAEIGRGTPFTYFQAWLELRPTDDDPTNGASPFPTVTASVGFDDPGNPTVAEHDDGWVKSDVTLPGAEATTLWLDTRECVDDQAPPPAIDKLTTIRASWEIDGDAFSLSCVASRGPSPNGKRTLSCYGGSKKTKTGVTYGFSGLEMLDDGCQRALEKLSAPFSYVPHIVSDWRE